MHRVRLLFLLGLLFALSATPLVRAQDATSGLDQNKTVAPDTKPEKAKDKDKSHRKHWWSPPHLHLHHKKNKKDSGASQAETNTKMSSSSKPVAQTPVNTAAARTNPAGKTVAAKPAKTKTVHATRPRRKTVARAQTRHKAVTRTHARRRRVARRSHGKKASQHNCSPAEAKKDGCQAYKTSQKKTTKS